MELIMKSIFGSHLYGTNNEQSDTDYKGIYLPSKEDCYLNKIVKSASKTTGQCNSKNSKEDVDEEIYSLQYFMKLALSGEMIVIDMLHTPMDKIIQTSEIWERLHDNRSMCYSKTLHGYLGYIKVQTAKYGIKGSRLSAMETFKKYLESQEQDVKLKHVWDGLPKDEYSMIVCNPTDEKIRLYECCGRKFPDTIRVHYALEVITKLCDAYGERARQARDNEGIDWKAVSHAFRAGFQLIEIYETGDLKYPLEQSDYIREIKEGKLHYKNDDISGRIENMLTTVQDLANNSTMPKYVEPEKLNEFILSCY